MRMFNGRRRFRLPPFNYGLPIFRLAPVNTVRPVISGTALSGQTLSVTTGIWLYSPSITYQWWKAEAVLVAGDIVTVGGVPVYTGAKTNLGTASTQLLSASEKGYVVGCTVTATNMIGSATKDADEVYLDPVYADAYVASYGAVDASASHTFVGCSLGVAKSYRTVTVGLDTQGGSAVKHATVTIGGVTATKNCEVLGSASTTMESIWSADVPTGSTGDIVITCDNGSGTPTAPGRYNIHIFTHSRGKTATATAVDSSAPLTQSLTIGANGMAIVASQGSNATSITCTFNAEVAEAYDENVIGAGNLWCAGGMDTTAGAHTVSATWTGGSTQRMCAAAFGAKT